MGASPGSDKSGCSGADETVLHVVKSALANVNYGCPSDVMCFANAIADAGSKFRSPEFAEDPAIALLKTVRGNASSVKQFIDHRAVQIACALSEVSDILKAEGKGGLGHDAAVAAMLGCLLKHVNKHSSVLEASARSDSKFLDCEGDGRLDSALGWRDRGALESGVREGACAPGRWRAQDAGQSPRHY